MRDPGEDATVEGDDPHVVHVGGEVESGNHVQGREHDPEISSLYVHAHYLKKSCGVGSMQLMMTHD